jgi:hypothetical protein
MTALKVTVTGKHTHGSICVAKVYRWETITSYTECPKEIKIKTGDTLTMDAFYDLTKHKLNPQSASHRKDVEGLGK